MPVWTIYCHTHVESGRRYIGLTKLTLLRRWNQHLQKAKGLTKVSRSHFWNAIRAYGKDAFSHEIIEVCTDLDVANMAEDCWIELFDTRNPERGFNVAKGGSHTPHPIRNPWDRPGYRERNTAASKAALNTPESRARRSQASREVWSDPESRENIVNAVRESRSRPEVRERLSAAQKGKTLSPEHRARISASSRASDPEVRARISAATREAMARPEVRAKTEGVNVGRKHGPEHRARISEAGKGRVLSQETRDRIAASLKARPRPPKCRRGHDVDGVRPDGRVLCRACRNEAQRRRREGDSK